MQVNVNILKDRCQGFLVYSKTRKVNHFLLHLKQSNLLLKRVESGALVPNMSIS